MNKKQQFGFGVIELLVIAVLLSIVGFAGYTVLTRNNKEDKSQESTTTTTTKDEAVKEASDTITYTDRLAKYSIKYPNNWTLTSKEETTYGPSSPNSEVTLKADTGLTVTLTHRFGGRGGDCGPSEGDMPHAQGNACSTKELLSLEKTGEILKGTDTTVSASSPERYKDAPVYLVRSKYTEGGTNAKTFYTIGLSSFIDKEVPKINSPSMGAFSENHTLSVFKGNVYEIFYIDTQIEPAGSSSQFFEQADVKQAEAILKSIKFDL